MILARIGAVLAALLWLFGTPLAVMAGVPFPSDAQDLIIGLLCSGLGLTLLPVALALPMGSSGDLARVARIAGVACCTVLVLSGAPVTLAVIGRLGTPAPGWVTAPPLIALIGLFLWVAAISLLSRADKATCWIGAITTVSFFVLPPGFALADIVSSRLQNDNVLILPFLLDEVLLWVALPTWLTVALLRNASGPPQAIDISLPS